MNRREAIAALMTLPATARITAADVKPDDVLVIECPGLVSAAYRERVQQVLAQVWPGRKCLVLEGGMALKLMSGK
jgi:hypothetical protein